MDKQSEGINGIISEKQLALLRKERDSTYLELEKTLTYEQKRLLGLIIGALKMESAIEKASAFKSGFNEGLAFFTKEQK